MVTLEKIQSSLFTNLHESFLREDDPLSNEQDWRNVFDYQWDTEFDHCGYALLDEGKVVGMIGMVFSDRLIAGVHRKFCNLHTWWVREDHRGRSLGLLRPVLKLNDYTITHFTPDREVRAITKRLGFSDLNSQLKILLPIGKDKRRLTDDQILYDEGVIESKLAARDKQILLDHRPYGLGHLLIDDAQITATCCIRMSSGIDYLTVTFSTSATQCCLRNANGRSEPRCYANIRRNLLRSIAASRQT